MKTHIEIFSDLIKEIRAMRDENAMLRAEAGNIRAVIEEIIDRYEVANMLAGDDPVIEKAKKALEK